jgi:hypothetical protein
MVLKGAPILPLGHIRPPILPLGAIRLAAQQALPPLPPLLLPILPLPATPRQRR